MRIKYPWDHADEGLSIATKKTRVSNSIGRSRKPSHTYITVGSGETEKFYSRQAQHEWENENTSTLIEQKKSQITYTATERKIHVFQATLNFLIVVVFELVDRNVNGLFNCKSTRLRIAFECIAKLEIQIQIRLTTVVET